MLGRINKIAFFRLTINRGTWNILHGARVISPPWNRKRLSPIVGASDWKRRIVKTVVHSQLRQLNPPRLSISLPRAATWKRSPLRRFRPSPLVPQISAKAPQSKFHSIAGARAGASSKLPAYRAISGLGIFVDLDNVTRAIKGLKLNCVHFTDLVLIITSERWRTREKWIRCQTHRALWAQRSNGGMKVSLIEVLKCIKITDRVPTLTLT